MIQDKSSSQGKTAYSSQPQTKKPQASQVVNRHSNYSKEWYEQRFEQLLGLDLIELDDDYYVDELFFKGADALDQKFTQLEEDNLFYIHRIQDIEQYLESTQENIDRTHDRLEAKTNALLENKQNLLDKIAEAQENLETFKKSSFGTMIQDQNSVLSQNVNKKKWQQPIDFEGLLGQIKKKIGEIKG